MSTGLMPVCTLQLLCISLVHSYNPRLYLQIVLTDCSYNVVLKIPQYEHIYIMYSRDKLRCDFVYSSANHQL